MISNRASQRYALAIFKVAEELNMIENVSLDLELIRNAIRASHELAILIHSPVINTEKKKQALRAIFGEKISELTLRFVILLTGKNREMLLRSIIDQYADLYDKHRGILNIAVRTAVKVTPDQEQVFARRLEGITGKKVRMTFSVDPAVRGGFTVQYGDTVVDASVRHQLDLLKNKLTEKIY